ncbi:MAG: hypothetical protein Kow0068_19870 [Marinilabiliales bacterium]
MKINDLNNRKLEGYIWLSDEKEPRILRNETFNFSSYEEGSNPFIVEAILKSGNKSIHIRHTDKYHIHEFDFDILPAGSVSEDVEYLPHKLKNVGKVNFKQLWVPEPDENCEGMPVLKMKALIFTGFDNQKNKEK